MLAGLPVDCRHSYCCWAFLSVYLHLLAIMLLSVHPLFFSPYFCWHPCCYWQPHGCWYIEGIPTVASVPAVAGIPACWWFFLCSWCPQAGIPVVAGVLSVLLLPSLFFPKYRNRLVFYLMCHYFWYCTVQSEYRIMDHKNYHQISNWSISLWNQWKLDCNCSIAQLC